MNNILQRVCRECGIAFPGGPRAWYCPQCREQRIKKANAEFKLRKKSGKNRIIGKTYTCVDCGEEYILASGNQTRCKECAKKHLKEVDNRQSQEWNKSNREKCLKAKRDYDKRRREGIAEKTGEKYICFDKANKKYRLRIKGKHIGYFAELSEAVRVRDELERSRTDSGQ